LVLAGDGAELATEVGKRLWGLDKQVGRVKIATTNPAEQAFQVFDHQGAFVVNLAIHEDPSPASQYAELQKLAAAFGLAGPEQFPPPASETTFAIANKRLGVSGAVQTWTAIYGPLAGIFHTFNPATDSFVMGANSELGAWLKTVHFSPRLTVRYPSIDVVFTQD
jgi:hypothetical protein